MKNLIFIFMMVLLLAMATMATDACADPWKDATLSWDPVTTYVDGSPLEPGDLDHYSLHCGTAPDFSPITVNVGLVTSYMISNDLPRGPGAYDCVARACTVPKCSGDSNRKTVTRIPKDVAAPTNLQ
jgi:hypothetical protein